MNVNATTDQTDETGSAPDTSPEPGPGQSAGGIVVGYDGSAASRIALDWAIETARERGRPLTIVHGMNVPATGYPAMDLAQVEPLYERTAREIVAEGAERAQHTLELNQIETQYWLGSPAGQIIEASKNAELVVLGSRGRGRILGGLLGSTSYAVAAHAHCPVVIVRAPEGEDPEDLPAPNRPGADHPILVGSDDSPPSERAVDVAARTAAETGAKLHIVRVAQPLTVNTWSGLEAGDGAGLEQSEKVLAWAEESLAKTAGRVRAAHPDLEVTTEAVFGDPGTVLAELGQNAGLIVVGSRGRGGFTGMLLGSVSHRVIHDAVCPVMVVR
ncbi:universal stress protein [Intrasporangium sp.]|uniref:universal stress protein n=1 Tax=Intrasporangium sp. TaxID=1925024 RepID=UPI00293974FB|nr:universal stress protein [Intrasporangium sp.]MDV3220917.1 universal stress protein [Intrasporangium sp.]